MQFDLYKNNFEVMMAVMLEMMTVLTLMLEGNQEKTWEPLKYWNIMYSKCKTSSLEQQTFKLELRYT